MSCPFFEEMKIGYCKAYPVKKMIPIKNIETTSPCLNENTPNCSIYNEYVSGLNGTAPTLLPAEEAKPTPTGECVWMHQEVFSFRLCTLNYECDRCQFEQMLQDRGEQYVESPEVIRAIEKLKKMPGPMRKCKYMLLGKVSTEPCYKNYECYRCPTYQKIKTNILELNCPGGEERKGNKISKNP
jgi:hypothetical protein